MKKTVVLGGGLVGRPIALDLAKRREFDVTVADIDENRLMRIGQEGVNTFKLDLKNRKETLKFLTGF